MPTIGDFIKIKHGYAFKGDNISIKDNGIVLVTPGNFEIGGGFKEQKCKFFEGEYPNEYVLETDDLIVTMTDLSKNVDTLGYSALVPFSDKRIYLHNQRIGLVQFISDKIDKHYLYWYMRTAKYQKTIAATSSGSTVHHTSPDRICAVEIDVPKFETQVEIAKFLDNIDSIIKINDEINRNLSEQCDAIYRDQFITKSDSSWTMGYLSDLITVKYGKDHKKLEDGDIPCYGSGGVMRYVERPIYDHESVLIPRKGTLNNVMYVNVPFWSVDTMFYTVMKISNVAKFVYHYVKGKNLASMNAGSAVPSMTVDILNAMELQIPSSTALAEFETIVQPLYKAMKDNEIENKKLAELRDTLLPKLMSGELDVSDLDI